MKGTQCCSLYVNTVLSPLITVNNFEMILRKFELNPHKQEKKQKTFNHAHPFKRHTEEFDMQSKAVFHFTLKCWGGRRRGFSARCSSRSVQMVRLRVDCSLELGD